MINGSFLITEEQIRHPYSGELVVVECHGSIGFHESQPEIPPRLPDI